MARKAWLQAQKPRENAFWRTKKTANEINVMKPRRINFKNTIETQDLVFSILLPQQGCTGPFCGRPVARPLRRPWLS